jgi:hypothetical protein
LLTENSKRLSLYRMEVVLSYFSTECPFVPHTLLFLDCGPNSKPFEIGRVLFRHSRGTPFAWVDINDIKNGLGIKNGQKVGGNAQIN